MRELLPFDGLSIAQHPRLSKCRRVNGTTLIGYSDSAIFANHQFIIILKGVIIQIFLGRG